MDQLQHEPNEYEVKEQDYNRQISTKDKEIAGPQEDLEEQIAGTTRLNKANSVLVEKLKEPKE